MNLEHRVWYQVSFNTSRNCQHQWAEIYVEVTRCCSVSMEAEILVHMYVIFLLKELYISWHWEEFILRVERARIN